MAQDAQRALGDVDGLVADALEIVIDAGNRQDKAQVNGHELMQREQLNHAVINLQLEFVNRALFFENAIGELFVGLQHGMDGLMNSALGETAHPEQAFLQFVKVSFEVAFHGAFLSARSVD
jgi:hypothetical protein